MFRKCVAPKHMFRSCVGNRDMTPCDSYVITAALFADKALFFTSSSQVTADLGVCARSSPLSHGSYTIMNNVLNIHKSLSF